MFIDTSEVKEKRNCARQWSYSSRNSYHLKPTVTPTPLWFGTIFHECMHAMYTGSTLEKILAFIDRECETDETSRRMLNNMISEYYWQVLPNDLEKYTIVDIEHRINFPLTLSTDQIERLELLGPYDPITATGSIDMIVVDKETNEVWGFEHKSAKQFKTALLVLLDEQPRLYYEALEQFVIQLNQRQYEQWLGQCEAIDAGNVAGVYPEEPQPYKLGGVMFNEVKKLQKKFEYKRTPCTYTAEDRKKFMEGFKQTCIEICERKLEPSLPCPEPSLMKCQMCSFQSLCETYVLSSPSVDTILTDFEGEYSQRTEDHLDEKLERGVE